MFCKKCGKELKDGSMFCDKCGTNQTTDFSIRKSRIGYILLGLFLGMFGIHNFYAGYNGRAIAQLLITCLGFWLFLPLIAVGVWVLIDICTITEDANGVKFD